MIVSKFRGPLANEKVWGDATKRQLLRAVLKNCSRYGYRVFDF